MTAAGWLEIALFLAILTAITAPLGAYMARVYGGERVFFTPVLAPVERLLLRLLGVRREARQDWKSLRALRAGLLAARRGPCST